MSQEPSKEQPPQSEHPRTDHPQDKAKASKEELEKYKEEQKKRIAAFKVNHVDQSGNKVIRIFGRGDEFVVYEIAADYWVDSVKVYIDNETPEDDSGIIKKYNTIRKKFIEVISLLDKVSDKQSTKTLISQILISGISDNAEVANQQFDELKHKINKDYGDQFKNRMRLVISSLCVSSALIIVAFCCYYLKWWIEYDHIRNLVYICAAGGIGGFFSITIGVNKIVCEKDVKNWLYNLYGIERMIISILASTIIYFSIKADIIFGSCNKMENPIIGYIVFSFVAGFSETLVPNLLARLEKE